MLTSLRELLFEEDLHFTTRVLDCTVMMPVDDMDIKLNIGKDKHIMYIKRMRSIENEPALLQETYIPYHLCPFLPGEDIESNSLFDLLGKKYGIKITRVKNYIEIACLRADEARLLSLTEGAPAVLLTQYFYSGDTLVMYTRSIKRTDRFKFLMALERKAA